MGNKSDNFWGGFLLGTALGAALGAVVAIKLKGNGEEETSLEGKEFDNRDIALTLEEKIAQLNAAIDAVREELAVSDNKSKTSV